MDDQQPSRSFRYQVQQQRASSEYHARIMKDEIQDLPLFASLICRVQRGEALRLTAFDFVKGCLRSSSLTCPS